jgi:hypothetical protein
LLVVPSVPVVLLDVRVELRNFSVWFKLKFICARHDLLRVSKLVYLVLFLGKDALFILITPF